MVARDYAEVALDPVYTTGVPKLLSRCPGGAVVLERVARGAGATRWYVVMTVANLPTLATSMSPGSSGQLLLRRSHPEGGLRRRWAAAVLDAARADGDAIVGQLGDDELTLKMEFVAGQAELDAYVDELRRGAPVFYGHFPAADDDAKHAVTFALPDSDGIVRAHRH